ncbi:MAG: GNAT family N-acetyltransferase [Candidatus Dojkabacteria bacterium]|nr:MAG: GNAT family N-acetyltransferase [Candidatus Dojkabacteria bacterium]
MEVQNFSFLPTDQKTYLANIKKGIAATFYNQEERLKFLSSQKRNLKTFSIKKNGKQVGVLSYQKVPAKSGTFIYFQHSPVLEMPEVAQDQTFWNELFAFAYQQGRKENAVYARFTPRIIETQPILEMLDKAGFKKAPVQEVDAAVTRIVELETYSDKKMTKQTKERIQKATENDLSVSFSMEPAAFESFMVLYKKVTSKTDTFKLPLEYMKQELEIYLKAKKLLIALAADSQGTVFSGAAIVVDKPNAWYYWTVTSDKGQEVGSHELLIAELISYLKGKGYATLDLWGESVPQEVYDKKLSHPWLAIDTMKKGFGTTLVEYITPVDVPVNLAIYRASCLYQRFNMSRRGYPFLDFVNLAQ